MLAGLGRVRRQGPDDVPARDGTDQAPVLGHDRHRALGGDLGEHRVEAGPDADRAGIEIEKTGDGLARAGGREPVGADAADEAPVLVRDEPDLALAAANP